MLYEPGFEGWDVSMATVWTDYAIVVVGLLCAGRIYTRHWLYLEAVSASFVRFAFCESMAYGFGGVSHHMLSSYFQDGVAMSKRWGEGSWEWMIFWLVAMVFGPLGTAFGFDLAMCIMSVDNSGTIAFFWSLFSAVVSLGVTFRNGAQAGGVWFLAAGWLSRVVAYLLVLTAPPACKGGESIEIVTEAGATYRTVPGDCVYSKHFNHNAIFHVLVALSLVFILFGVDAKLSTKEREAACVSMVRILR
mmetsp:Transcript_130386/g.364854  ORF Transcript_130386/g.364854 Transcript_130386/m.364854 type:complete len:247 (+) Transcript_130386:3-743(+)